jgi:AraC-like DNA-binding protein
MPSYAEFEPRADLRRWVRLLWRYEDASPSRTVQRVPPDGCPELILHLTEPYEEQAQDGSFVRQPRAIFAGQMTRPLCLRATGPVACVALRFEPDGAAAWFGAPMDAATDKRLDVTSRIPIAGGLDAGQALDLLQRLLAASLERQGWPFDEALRADILRDAEETAAPVSPAERRRIQRLYLKQVGVPQRMLQSVFRFRRVFDHAQGAGGAWLDAALEAGYFDQPQMARDFRRFLGCTATQWAREQAELAREMAAPRHVSAS